jgi:hypothetical protein
VDARITRLLAAALPAGRRAQLIIGRGLIVDSPSQLPSRLRRIGENEHAAR